MVKLQKKRIELKTKTENPTKLYNKRLSNTNEIFLKKRSTHILTETYIKVRILNKIHPTPGINITRLIKDTVQEITLHEHIMLRSQWAYEILELRYERIPYKEFLKRANGEV